MPDGMAAAAAVEVPQTLVRTVGMVAYVRLVPRLATAPERLVRCSCRRRPAEGLIPPRSTIGSFWAHLGDTSYRHPVMRHSDRRLAQPGPVAGLVDGIDSARSRTSA